MQHTLSADTTLSGFTGHPYQALMAAQQDRDPDKLASCLACAQLDLP